MGFETIIFDLDGTLVYTDPEHRYSVVGQTLQALGVRDYSENDIDRFWFGPKRDEIIKKVFKVNSKCFWKNFRKFDTVEFRRQLTKPFHDIDIIDELRQREYQLAIVTGAPRHIAALEVGMIGEDNFDAIILAGYDRIKEKPHPQALEECLDAINGAREETIYVGNSDEDIVFAENAGVPSILVARGDCKITKKPSFEISSLYELRDILWLD